MRSIQEVGTEILTGYPANFYVFAGEEYGIKREYIDALKSYYDGRITESESVVDVLNIMNRNQLVPQPNSLHVIRYDKDFISYLDSSIQSDISRTNIRGTIVCIYEDEKHVAKLSKYLPDYTVVIGEVDSNLISKYIKRTYPNLDDRLVSIASKTGRNYSDSKNIASSMSLVKSSKLSKLSDNQIGEIFSSIIKNDSSNIKSAVASKNSKKVISIADGYEGDHSELIYEIMNSLMDIEKSKVQRSQDPKVSKYLKYWKASDIYFMFENCYNALIKMRRVQADPHDLVITLASLLSFESISVLVEDIS